MPPTWPTNLHLPERRDTLLVLNSFAVHTIYTNSLPIQIARYTWCLCGPIQTSLYILPKRVHATINELPYCGIAKDDNDTAATAGCSIQHALLVVI